MSAALGLYRLQQVDSQMDQAQSRLRTIQQTLENDETLRAANAHLAAKEEIFRKANALLKQSEVDFEKQRLKLEQTEASLYGGHVHKPKELQDLQKDVASLKKHLETLEERELEAMDAAEKAENEWKQAQAGLEAIQSDRGAQSLDLTKESDALNKEMERLSSERNAVMSDLASQAIGIYDQLRKQRRGVAVTTVSDGSCASCGTTLTQALQQNARSANQLHYCPTCGRILFAN